jgi:hypothetical protein
MPQAGPTDDDVRPDAARPEAAPLRRLELLLVLAAWVFFAVLNLATGLLDGRGDGPGRGTAVADLEARHVVLPAVWAVLTTLVLWGSLSSRPPRWCTTTAQPAAARVRAMAAPRRLAAPVTRATRS